MSKYCGKGIIEKQSSEREEPPYPSKNAPPKSSLGIKSVGEHAENTWDVLEGKKATKHRREN